MKEQQEIGKQVDEILKDYECDGQIDIWEWEKEQGMENIFTPLGRFPVLNPDEIDSIEIDEIGNVTYHTSIGDVKLLIDEGVEQNG